MMRALTLLSATRAPMASFAAMGVLWGCFAALVPDTKAMLGVNDATFGLLFLCSSGAAVVAMLLAPRVGTALGAWALPVVTLSMALAFALPGHLAVVPLFALAMVLLGASSGMLDVLMNARVSVIEAERGLHLMNLNHAAYSFGYTAGAVVTGMARSAGASPAEALGSGALIAALMALATVERGARLTGLGRPAAGAAGLGIVPVLGGLIILIAFLAENAAEAWSALHIERTLGGSAAEGALGPALLGLTMGIGRLSGQFVSARVAEPVLLRGAGLLAAAGAAIAAMAGTPAVAYLGFMVLGLGASVIAPTAFAMVGRLSDPEARSRAIARASVLGYLGFFFGPPLLGGLSEIAGLRASFAAVALVLLALLLLVPRLARQDR